MNREQENGAMARCFLFDIDGTLVNLRSIWEEMYMSLYEDVAGVHLTPVELLSKFGPPEYDGHRAILHGRGVYSVQTVEALVAESERRMIQRLGKPDISNYVIPYVRECLAALDDGLNSMGIVTGNMKPIAEAILEGAGLRKYFTIVGCSDENTTKRAEIVQKAVSAFNWLGKSFSGREVYVIGDTPLDVRAAKECGYVSVAVATGHYSFEELRKERPDMLLKDLRYYATMSSKVRV